MFDNRISIYVFCKECQYAKYFSIIKYRVACFARNFALSFFSDVTKVQNAGLLMVRSQTD